MKFSTAAATVLALTTSSMMSSVNAFAPTTFGVTKQKTTQLFGFDLSGNTWKPDSEKMGSTDTGDYLPEGYNPEEEIAFSSGMMGSQASLGNDHDGPQLPGLENVGADAVMMGGIEMASDIPEGMEFVPSSVPDGEIAFQVASSGAAGVQTLEVAPVCMTFEDYFAAFAPASSHPSLSVTPATGRMDRRGGEVTVLDIQCDPKGAGGTFTGDLVINLPEDNSKICYKVTVSSL